MKNNPELKPAVVLVADRTLSASYKILFEGIFATMQTTQVPEIAMRRFVSPAAKADALGRAHTAPLGIRRVASALINHTPLGPDDVVCTTPERLGDLLGPWTKVVGVSSSDPLGQGMSNTTTLSFWEGELYTKYWTRQMLEQIAEAKQKYGFKVIGGGAGAWQWDRYDDETADNCIDVVFEGYFENLGPQLVMDILAGKDVPKYVCEKKTAIENTCPIDAASMLGIIELSRGCGRGCGFCSMSNKKMNHMSPETICADLQTNVAAGIRSVVSGSEDFFRYGAQGLKPDFEQLCGLLEQMRQVKGLSFMQIDHGNVSSVAQLNDEQLKEIRRLLTWEKHCEYLWVNMGVESANGQLVAQNCRGKISPYRPEDWEQLVRDTADKMTRTGFYSVFSLVLGMPGETGADVAQTLKLVKYLETKRAVIFPVFYEPLGKDEIATGKAFRVEKMTHEHLELYRTCYEINFRNVPKLFWDNQRAGGVSWIKRAMMRVLGKTEVRAWRKKFVQLDKQLITQQNRRADCA